MNKLVLLLLFLLTSLSSAKELLTWEKSKLSYSAKLSDKGTLFSFRYKNKTDENLKVERVKSSCSCMTVNTPFPVEVLPGKEGVIEAYYDFTGKVGLNRGNLEVVCNGVRIELGVEVDIPVPVTIAPRFLIWKKGVRNAKDIKVDLHPEWQGKITNVKSSLDGIQTEMTKSDTGFSIKVTPPPVEAVKKKRSWLLLNGVDEKGMNKEYRIYLILN